MGEKKHSANIVFTLALLGLFALSALFVAVLGAQVYGRTAEQMDQNYNTRTSLVYIGEKIRQTPGREIVIDDVEGSQALVLKQNMDGREYESWIFSAGGKLKEVMVPAGTDVKSEDGQGIMEISKFSLFQEGNLLSITVYDQFGDKDTVTMSVGG